MRPPQKKQKNILSEVAQQCIICYIVQYFNHRMQLFFCRAWILLLAATGSYDPMASASLFYLKKTELFSVYELKSEVNPTPKDARPNVSIISSSETASSTVADVPVTAGIAGAVNSSQLWQFDKAFFPSASRNANKDENLSEASARIINQIQASKDEATTLPNDTIKVRFHCLSSRNSTLKPDSNKHTPSVIPGGLATVAILVQSRHGRCSGPGNQSTCW